MPIVMKCLRPLFVFFVMLSLGLPAGSTATAGQLGVAAPELQVKAWIQGGPLTLADGAGKTVFVIEFWQTDCPHCRESLPFLSMLQEQYRKDGVVIVGIAGDDADTVKAFLKENPTVTYTVGVDDADQTYDRYMEMFGVSGVPHAFVVGRQGKILWEGHPMDNLDAVLQQVVSGEYDLAAVQQAARVRKLLFAYVYLCTETDEKDIARQVGDRVFHYSRDDAALLEKLAGTILTHEEIQDPDLELASRAGKRACELTGETDRAVLEMTAIALHRMGARQEALAYWKKAKRLKKDAGQTD